jgi:hypothetical protein
VADGNSCDKQRRGGFTRVPGRLSLIQDSSDATPTFRQKCRKPRIFFGAWKSAMFTQATGQEFMRKACKLPHACRRDICTSDAATVRGVVFCG